MKSGLELRKLCKNKIAFEDLECIEGVLISAALLWLEMKYNICVMKFLKCYVLVRKQQLKAR